MSNEIRNEGMWEEIDRNRGHMKCPDFAAVMPGSDQQKALPQPPLCKGAKGGIIRISADFGSAVTRGLYTDILDARRSERVYDEKTPMTQDQLAFLLWSTQGIQEIRGENYAALRPVPSGGARHSFETYFIVRDVEGLKKGLYHYLPLEHIGEKLVAVEFLGEFPDHDARLADMLAGQKWAISAPVVVFLTCVAYRSEWRYVSMAHRVALIDLGHVGQNLMLSAVAMGLGSCCLAAYDQKLCDEALGVDGYEEYTVYACPVGKAKK
jgi:SagB-type dehydrogenase family enzyme